MEAAGWKFNWNDGYLWRPAGYCDTAAKGSYCGFLAGTAQAWLELQLAGEGTAHVNFGNPYNAGQVQLFVNTKKVAVAMANTPQKHTDFIFKHGDVLKLTEMEDTVMALNSVTFACGEYTLPPP